MLIRGGETQAHEGTTKADVGVMLADVGGRGCHLQAEERSDLT